MKEEKISDENGRKPRDRTRSQTFSLSSRQASKEKLDLPTQNVKLSTHKTIHSHKIHPHKNLYVHLIQQKLRVMERKKNSILSVKVRYQKALKILQSFPKKRITMRLIRKFYFISGPVPVYFRFKLWFWYLWSSYRLVFFLVVMSISNSSSHHTIWPLFAQH